MLNNCFALEGHQRGEDLCFLAENSCITRRQITPHDALNWIKIDCGTIAALLFITYLFIYLQLQFVSLISFSFIIFRLLLKFKSIFILFYFYFCCLPRASP